MRLVRYSNLVTFEGDFYVFNQMNGTILQISYDTYKALKNQDYDSISEEEKSFLANRGFLVKDTYDEKAILDLDIQRISHARPSTFSLAIGPTMSCNFNCFYCFEQDFRHKTPPWRKMSKETADQTIKFVQNTIPVSTPLEIIWYGGEPLLAPEVIEYLGARLQEVGYQFKDNETFIITNGYYLTEKNVKKLVDTVKLRRAQVTIDGPRNIHNRRRPLIDGTGTYDVIMGNVAIAAHYLDSIVLKINVDKTNVEYVPDLLDIIKNELPSNVFPSVDSVATETVENPKFSSICFTAQEYASVYKQYFFLRNDLPRPSLTCSANTESGFGIDDEGYLYKCWEELGKKSVAVGNVWEGITNYELYKKWLTLDTSKYPEKCESCSILPLCGAGHCPNKILFPDHYSNSIDCIPSKWFLEDFLKSYIKKYRNSIEKSITLQRRQ